MTATIELSGHDLTVDDVERVAVGGATAVLGACGLAQIEASRALIDRVVADETPTYGVNTGFGRFVDVHIAPEQAARLQLNLLRSHACGVGEPFPDEVVRAATLLRANALAKGTSGVRPEPVRLLLDMLAAGVVPVVPSRGSLGASGDLAPLAHLGLVLVGEGAARVGGETLPGGEALARAGLEPVVLAAKEGLALINGTQFMAAVGALVLARARRLVKLADVAAAQTIEALRASRTPFAPELQALRPHPGQVASAANLYRLLDDSEIVASHRWCGRVQDAYSLRCCPAGARGRARRGDLRRGRRRDRAERGHRQPDRDRRAGRGALERQLPRPADRLCARHAEARPARARLDQRAPDRAAAEPGPLERPAAVPDRRRRPELGLHDRPVRGREPGQRGQGARAPGERRLDPDQRKPGGSRVDGRDGRRAPVAGVRERRARARHRAAVRGAGARLPGAEAAGTGPLPRPTPPSARSRRTWPTTARSRPRSRRSPRACATGRCWRSVEAGSAPLS